MVNQYLGSTIISGASFLNTRGIINFQEGFNDGVSDHLLESNVYYIDDISNGGFGNQTVSINASSPFQSLKRNSFPFTKQIPGAVVYYNDFNSENDLNDITMITGSAGITNSCLKFGVSDNTGHYFTLKNLKMRDFSWTMKLKSSRWTNTGGIYPFGRYHPSVVNVRIEGVQMRYGFSKNSMFLANSDIFDQSYVWVANSGIAMTDNQYYWINYTVRGTDQKLSYSTTGKDSWTLLAQKTGLSLWHIDRLLEAGEMGMFMSEGVTTTPSTVAIDYMLITELIEPTTRNDVAQIISNAGGIHYDSQNQVTGFTPYWVGASGWGVGVSGSVSFNGIAGRGSSWSSYMTTGATFSDFVATVDCRNAGLPVYGLQYGTTNNSIGFYLNPNTGMGSTLQLEFDEVVNGVRTYFYAPSEALMGSSVSHSVGLIKNGNIFTGLVDGIAVASHIGLSVYDSLQSANQTEDIMSTTGSVGVRVWIGIGGSVTFSNFKISQYDDIMTNVVVNQGDNLSSAFNNIVDAGSKVTNKPDGIYVSKIGASNGTHLIGASGGVMVASRDYDYSQSHIKTVSEKNNLMFYRLTTGASANMLQADSSMDTSIYGKNTTTFKNLKNDLTAEIVNSQLTNDRISLTILGRPTIEINDTVTLVDETLGVSDNYVVNSFTKSSDISSGSYTQTLDLRHI